ncbi:MAG: putative transposase [Oleiphilaceae bacterium]|jgi:putative transposase
MGSGPSSFGTRTIRPKLSLKCTQRLSYKSTTNSNYKNRILHNVLDQQLNPDKPNQVWSTDITDLPTREGWVCLAIVMDLHSRKIVGWSVAARMTTALIMRALQHASALRKPLRGLLHHSDRGSQYTSRTYREQFDDHGIKSAMIGKGNCYDNAVVERFFGGSKYEWLANVIHLTREGITTDVNQYINHNNGIKLHATLDYQIPNEYKNSQIKVCN